MTALKTDTWAIIGAGAAMAAVIVSIMLAQNAATNARIDLLQEAMREEHAALRAEIGALRAEHHDLRAEHDAMRAEHVAIMESLSVVAQRVSYVEGRLDVGLAAESEPVSPP
ncbi:MAG: hypothetical protein OXF98_03815 [Rhodospirillaceae bacterium]|nr:hypothetical protein [Rhodospirillaceae bacterium]